MYLIYLANGGSISKRRHTFIDHQCWSAPTTRKDRLRLWLMSSWCVFALCLLPLAVHALPFAHLCWSFLLTHTVVVLLSWAPGGILKGIPVYSSFWLFIVVIVVFKAGRIPFFIFSRWRLYNWIVFIILWHLRLLIGMRSCSLRRILNSSCWSTPSRKHTAWLGIQCSDCTLWETLQES